MLVKIIKSSSPNTWYANHIGETYEVNGELFDNYYRLTNESNKYILYNDTTLIHDDALYQTSTKPNNTPRQDNTSVHNLVTTLTSMQNTATEEELLLTIYNWLLQPRNK